MNRYLKSIRPTVLELEPYHLSASQVKIKLNQNESPYDLPVALKQDILQEISELAWNRYPQFKNDNLQSRLADYLHIDANRLLIGNGSNDLLQLLINLILPVNATVLTVSPTFAIYRQLCHIAGLNQIDISFDADWQFPVEKIISLLEARKIDLCILCSPNSPTGASIPEEDLLNILQKTKGLVLVDEAYYEFSKRDYSTFQPDFKNLILSRTFSKAMGLAGLRIGYFIAAKELQQELAKAKLPYNLNIFSELVATRLLENMEAVEMNIQKILNEKKILFQHLNELDGLTVYPSDTNFFMIESSLDAPVLFKELQSREILVRDISKQHPRLENKLRITVGSYDENTSLVNVLAEILNT